MTGYEALRDTAAQVDLSARGKIRVSGEDRARLLHAMTTNHVQEMQSGDCRYAFFLNSQGRILADVWILNREEDFLLITEPETRQRVYEHLDQYIIADDVQLEDLTEQCRLLSLEGPEAAGKEYPLPFTATGQPGGALLLLDPAEPSPWTEYPFADADAVRTVRIENAKPRYGEEISDRYLVQETGQMQAMHFSKGCYLGQEIVERVRSRGQVHRHLRGLRIEGTDVPEAGVKLESGAGEIVSAAYSPALGETVAMAYLRTDAAESGKELLLGERRVRVV